MIIVNTTIHVEARNMRALASWLKEVFLPQAREAGAYKDSEVMRVLGGREDDPDGVNLAVRTVWSSLAESRAWYGGEGQQLLSQWAQAHGGPYAVLFFTTYLSSL